MDEITGQALGATAVALFVTKEVFAYLKSKNGSNGENGKYYERERWKAIQDALDKNTHAQRNTTQVLSNLVQITKDVKDEVKELGREIRK